MSWLLVDLAFSFVFALSTMPDSGAELQRQTDLIRRKIEREIAAGHFGILQAGTGKIRASEIQA